MELTLREITSDDVPVVIDLIREFAAFEGLADHCEVTAGRLREAMFGEGGIVEGIMAFDGDTAIGYAIFYPNFASFRGQKGLYLEDIYIRAEYRKQGVGEMMIKEIARLAASRGFERLDLLVLDWNTAAASFYKKLGAVRDDGERHFKFTDDAFQRLAE